MKIWWRCGWLAMVVSALMFSACGDADDISDGGGVDADLEEAGAAAPADATTPASDAASVDASSTDDASSMEDASTAEPGSREEFCGGSGPLVVVGDMSMGEPVECGPSAAVTFRYALCVCQDIATSGPVSTDSFDSSMGPFTPADAGAGASVGSNGQLQGGSANIDIQGTLSVDENVNLLGMTTIAGDLNVDGRLSNGGALTVGGDARISGGIGGSGTQSIAGTLDTAASVTIEPPCDCTEDLIFDVGAYVRSAATANDNAEVGVDTAALDGYSGTTRLDLDCGRYYFSGIRGTGDLTIRISGRTAIFVAASTNINGSLTLEMDAGAELDLFIEDNLSSSGSLSLGGADTPSRVRVYVGGEGSTNLAGSPLIFGGNLYAPRAELTASGVLTVYGSIFARRVAASGGITVHYDRAILEVEEDCPDDGCDSCRDCDNQACIDGECGDCRTSADCCEPLICDRSSGRCVPLI